MKIAYILPSLRNKGPIIVAKKVIDFLVEWGHEVDVFFFDEFSSAMNFKCPVHCITMYIPIDFDKYDIIHCHCFRPDVYASIWKNKIHKAKLISTLHQDTYRYFCYQYPSILAYVVTRYWCYVQSKFDGVISISNQLKDLYCNKIKSPITTIYNGCSIHIDENVDIRITNRLKEIKLKYKLLGTYAYVARGKGLGQIIQAISHLQDYAFVVIGEGPDIENLKQKAQILGVLDKVLFFPYQENPCNYLSFFDVYVMPSYSEGFGLAMVEAALAKKSIVCSDIPSFREIFPNGEANFFELDNIDSLQKSISIAFENRILYGERAYARVIREFTTKKMAENHLKYYQNIIHID